MGNNNAQDILSSPNADDFIIRYHHNNKHNDEDVIAEERRIVFVSLTGLYDTWDQCPSSILYFALFILPLKRKWIYHPFKYRAEIEAHSICEGILRTKEFVELLKWKDSQHLLFYMLDDPPSRPENSLVSPFWSDLSAQLSALYDPITRSHYKPLKLDTRWWEQQTMQKNFKYCVDSASVLFELYFVTMVFRCIQEIIYQSNPNSLLPVTSYKNDNAAIRYANNVDPDIQMDDTWWVSEEYPVDL
eukprot:546157_1